MANKTTKQGTNVVKEGVVDPVNWRVAWEIDIEAVSAEEAAVKALHIMRDSDPANTAVVFQCTGPSVRSHVVDLLALSEEA